MNESNEVEIHAEVSGLPPKPTSEHLFESVELSAEPKFLKFHVVSGSPLFFDQRLLKARYQYFTRLRGSLDFARSQFKDWSQSGVRNSA